jgi:hypothetical protein
VPVTDTDQEQAEPADPDTAAPPEPEEEKDEKDEGAEAQERASDKETSRGWRRFDTEIASALESLVGVRTTNLFVGSTIGTVGDHHAVSSSQLGMVLRSGPVPAPVLDRIRKSYVEPTGYRDLRGQLDERRFVLLRARGGTGRTTTALRMLDHLCREGVRKLDPDAELKALDTKDLTENHGYLLEWLDPEQAGELRAFHAERIAQLMHDNGCRLVVIVDDSTELRHAELTDHIAPDFGDVEPGALLERHVSVRLRESGDGTSATDLLARPEVKELVTELSADLSRRELVGLADLLVRVAEGRTDLDEVRQRYSAATEASFGAWFDEQNSTEQRAFVIALAVFNNEPVQTVLSAAKLLAERIRVVETPRRTDRARAVFGISLTQRLATAKAELFDDVQDTGFGKVAVTRVRFRDESYPVRVLKRVYSEYDEAFDVVHDWLLRLGSIPGPQIRVRAGMAAGLLSLSDFSGIYHRMVLPWADSGDNDEREAAVAALQIPSRSPAHAPTVCRMLDHWVKQNNNEARRVTGLRALGSTTAMSPAAALKLLRYAARRADWTMAYAIGESVVELYKRADDPDQVLAELVKWAGDDEFPLRRETALLSVLIVSNYLDVRVAESTQMWPVMLWAAENLPAHREQIVDLFARMLGAAHFMRRGYLEVRRWTRLAQKDTTLRRPLAALLFEIGATAEELDSIRYHLDYWAAERNGPKAAVADLLTYLDEEESRRG